MRKQRLADVMEDAASHWDALTVQELMPGTTENEYNYVKDTNDAKHRTFHAKNMEDNMVGLSTELRRAARILRQLCDHTPNAKGSGIVSDK